MNDDLAAYQPFRSRRRNNTALKDVRWRLLAMRRAVQQTFLTDESRAAYWQEREYEVTHAEWRVISCQRQFYVLRLVALISAIIVPALVGLNLSGTGGTVVRWTTFAFSLVAAVSTGVLTLYRVGDRWLMYRKLATDLIRAGWRLLEDAHAADADRAWAVFTRTSDRVVAEFNAAYAAAVIQTARPARDDGGDEAGSTGTLAAR